MDTDQIEIGGPYFEDLFVGQVLEQPPAVTVNAGHAIMHQALFGDRLRLPLDQTLSQAVTGRETALANPNLVCNIAIGQTTYASQRVRGNLFYRGLVMRAPVHIGDTLRTTTEVKALRQNRPKPGRPATGMVVLEIRTENQDGATVLHFWRAPMIPCRDPEADTGHADSFDAFPAAIEHVQLEQAVPETWDLAAFAERVPGPHFAAIEAGSSFRVEARDTVSTAPELARATLNMAHVHTDAGASVYGRRLVYGGHTISMASAQIVRALPGIVTLVGWRSCDHTGPVFEQDILRTEVTVVDKHPRCVGGFVDLHARVFAERGPEAPKPGRDVDVLDWHVIALMA